MAHEELQFNAQSGFVTVRKSGSEDDWSASIWITNYDPEVSLSQDEAAKLADFLSEPPEPDEEQAAEAEPP